jgi:hypothetical protein
MAFELEVAIIDGGDRTIKVVHYFYGETEEECETYKREHLHTCSYFKSAHDDGRILENLEEIDDDELPETEDFAA